MSVSNHTINFNANLGPLQGALQGFGTTAEGLLTRLKAVAEAPVNIPVGVTVGKGSLSGLNRPFREAAALPLGSFGTSGRINADVRANLEAQVRRQISQLSKDDIRGPARGETRGRALLAERRAVLEKAALQKLTELIAVREADIANQIKLGSLRVREEQLILASKDKEFLAQEAVVETLAGEAALRRANNRRMGATGSAEQQARRAVVETEATVATNNVKRAAISSEDNKLAVIGLANARGKLAGEASIAKDKELAAVLGSEEATVAKANVAVARKRLSSSAKLAAAEDAEAAATRTAAVIAERRASTAAAGAASADLSVRNNVVKNRLEKSITTDLAREVIATNRNANLAASASRLDRAQARGGVVGGLAKGVNNAGGVGGFFGSGLATTLRFAVPSILLFGAITGVAKLIKEAEDLRQIFVRLDSQFQSLGQRGVFGGQSPTEQAALASKALEGYREELFSIAAATGLANVATVEMGQKFIGLFASIDSGSNVQQLAETATRITSEFSVITGLNPDETFNDLVGSVRSFGETGTEILDLINDLTDAVINVGDATGVSAGEITDFVGRIGPAAAQAGLELNQVIALGATALQGSGVGGAALAEQFGRILTGLSGKLGVELARLAQDFKEQFSNIDLGDGTNVADLFNVDTIATGQIGKVLTGLINGFDGLTEAEQRQIISSIGSRREGASLAAVLQNASTFNNALSAATDANGQRQERFGDIIVNLTGQLEKLKVSFAQTGQRLFESGLGEALSGLISGLAGLAGVFDILVSVMSLTANLFDKVLPNGAAKMITQFGLLILVLRPFTKASIAANVAAGRSGVYNLAAGRMGVYSGAVNKSTAALTANAVAAGRATAGVRSFSAATSLGSRAAGGIARAIGPVNAALLAGFAAFSLYKKVIGNTNERIAKTEQSQKDLGSILSSNSDRFDVAATAARNYVSALSDVNDLSLPDFVVGGFSKTETGTLASSVNKGLVDRAIRENDAAPSQLLDKFLKQQNLDLEGLIKVAQEDQDGTGEILKELIDFRNNKNGLLTRMEAAANSRSFLKVLKRRDDTPAIFKDLINEALKGGDETVFRIADALNNAFVAEKDRKDTAENAARVALESAITANDSRVGGITSEELEVKINSMLKGSNDAVPDAHPSVTLLEQFGFNEQKNLEIQAKALRENIDFVKNQFDAGLIGRSEFAAAINEEIASLQVIIDSEIRSGSNDALIAAAENQKEVNGLRGQLVKIVKDDFDRTIELQKLLGKPLEGADLSAALGKLILNPNIVAGSAAFSDIAGQIVEAQKSVALELISKATTVEEVDKIVNDFSLDIPGSLFFTVNQVSNKDIVGEVLTLVGTAEGGMEVAFRGIADALELGGNINDILNEIIQTEIDSLGEAINLIRGPDESDVRNSLLSRVEALRGIAARLAEKPVDIAVGANVSLGSGLSEGNITDLEKSQKELIDNFEQRAKIFAATGQNQDLGSKVKDLVALINDPAIIDGSQEALSLAIDLADAIRQGLELEGAEAEAFTAALLGLADATGLGIAGIAEAGLIFQQLANAENNFNVFLAEFLGAGSDLLNGLLQTIAVLMAGGASAEEALGRSVAESIAKLRRQRRLINRFGQGRRGSQAEAEAIDESIRRLESIPQIDIPEITGVHITPRKPSAGGGGSSAADDAAKAAIELQNAKFALLRAQIGDDPVKLAVLAGQEAQFEIDIATNEAERIRGLASQVDARRGFWSAVNDVLQAENDLAIAVAGSLGDFAKVEELTVAGAKAQLDFLVASGAGAAAIARAEAAIIGAQDNQANALVNARLGDLGFLFSIGELSQSAYISALEGVVAQLDPVADQDLWRQVTKQLHDLKGSASELQFNLPDIFELPTLFEVRRLNQNGIVGSTNSAGGFGGLSAFSTNNDNRQIEITINVATGMDWQDARQVIGDAIGADQSVFSLNTKKY